LLRSPAQPGFGTEAVIKKQLKILCKSFIRKDTIFRFKMYAAKGAYDERFGVAEKVIA